MKDSTIEYMGNTWNLDDIENFDDIYLFWTLGFYELVAKRLVDAGAVEPNCKAAKDMIKTADALGAQEERDMIDEALKGVTVVECGECNHNHFLHPDYCYSAKELIKDGCCSCNRKGFLKVA